MLRPYLNRYGLTCRAVNDSTLVRDTLTMNLFNTAGCLLFAHSGHWLLWMSAVCQERNLERQRSSKN